MAVVAIAFGLSAVFIPVAFIAGITGQFYKQFALTIATSTLISAFNSLTLSPALAAIMLRPHGAKKDLLTRGLDLVFGWFFRGFNAWFHGMTGGYERVVRLCIRGTAAALLIYVGLLVLTYHSFSVVPTGFIPEQDKGYLLVTAQLPDSASVQRTREVLARMDKIALATPGVKATMGVAGQSFLLNANGSNFASMFVILKEFHDRKGPGLSAGEIEAKLRGEFRTEVKDALVGVFGRRPSTDWATPAASRS